MVDANEDRCEVGGVELAWEVRSVQRCRVQTNHTPVGLAYFKNSQTSHYKERMHQGLEKGEWDLEAGQGWLG